MKELFSSRLILKKKKKIKKYLSARRKMIPDGSLEMQKETKNNGNGKYVGKPK